MAVQYVAYLYPEGSRMRAEIPDCPGFMTYVDDVNDPVLLAALTAWISGCLGRGHVPPQPTLKSPAAAEGVMRAGVKVKLDKDTEAALQAAWSK